MAEVAANIEAKVSLEEFRTTIDERISRINEKVSFEDMKRYVALNGGQDGELGPKF